MSSSKNNLNMPRIVLKDKLPAIDPSAKFWALNLSQDQVQRYFKLIEDKVDLKEYLIEHCNISFIEYDLTNSQPPYRKMACCPFHKEKTPSFSLNRDIKGEYSWYCYGACGSGGTVISAAMKKENISNPVDVLVYFNDLYQLGFNDE